MSEKKDVTLRYTGLGPVSVTNGGGGVHTVKPGINTLKEDAWKAMIKHKDIQDMVSRGEKNDDPKKHDEKSGLGNIILIDGAGKDAGSDKDNNGSAKTGTGTDAKPGVPGNSKTAQKLVAETEDTGLLNAWLEKDERSGVRNAIEKKLKEIADYREEHGDKE